MSVGIFSWARLEPREGQFDFDWLDRVMDRLAKGGVGVMLATPTAARPAWLVHGYPETGRMSIQGQRVPAGWRHNHCPTSPVMRAKSVEINTRLAQRYAGHPALLAWHVNNEYGGECFCKLCRQAMADWARKRFADDVEAMNQAWCTDFWGRRLTDFDQLDDWICFRVPWREFTSDQCIDFFLAESAPLRRHAPHVPVTTNFMVLYHGLDYHEFARHVDFVCWDSYPHWHRPDASDAQVAADLAYVHDVHRGMKLGRPWVLMESQPQIAKGRGVLPLKRPGLHVASSLQAVAHGSDSVQYFQWRKGRSGEEKNHGAVVDHAGHENTRAFREVAQLGQALAKLDDVVGTTTRADVAFLHDWRSRWALETDGYLGDAMHQYCPTQQEHYRPFWKRGISTDVIGYDAPLEGYKLIVAPMLYMLHESIDERLADFVRRGGTLVATYGCAMVDRHDRTLLGGWPGGAMRKLLGVRHEETDLLYPGRTNPIALAATNELGLSGTFDARDVCEIVHAESAAVLGIYTAEFYAGTPAITASAHGKGRAYYLGARMCEPFLQALCDALAARLSLRRALAADLPDGVSATCRTDGREDFVFLMNFAGAPRSVQLGDQRLTDMLSGRPAGGAVQLAAYDCRIFRRTTRS